MTLTRQTGRIANREEGALSRRGVGLSSFEFSALRFTGYFWYYFGYFTETK
ncbi:MAG: hypothetical protein IJM30_01300 [Thermoguttaceae bacterium]|nr:hypothetical protein [Thermoguttaceae bacterium]